VAFSEVFPSPASLSLFLVLLPLIDIRFLHGTEREEVTLFRFILLRYGGARLSVIDGGNVERTTIPQCKNMLYGWPW